MTIKASLDGGNSRPDEYQTELKQSPGFGYSCLTMTDEHTIGIIYEGEKELYFQKVLLHDLLKGIIKNNR